jgi:hypothetical protein
MGEKRLSHLPCCGTAAITHALRGSYLENGSLLLADLPQVVERCQREIQTGNAPHHWAYTVEWMYLSALHSPSVVNEAVTAHADPKTTLVS